MARFFRRKRGFRKPKKVAKKSTAMPKKGMSLPRKVSMLAKNVLHLKKFDETKSLQYTIGQSGLTSYYNGNDGGSANTMALIDLGPNSTNLAISQGTFSNQRVGNRIEMVGGKIKFDFWAAPYDATNNPYPMPGMVKIWLVTRKDTAYQKPVSSLPSFFQAGSSAVPPNGYFQDLVRTVNTDLYRVYKQYTLKIGNSGVTGTNASAGNEYFANNDFKLNRRLTIDYTKWLIKNVKYNDSDTQPTCRGLYLVMCFYSATNIGLSPGAYPIQYLAEKTIKWKDT